MQRETIEGVVEEIIYYSAESGYTVLSLQLTIAIPQTDEVVVVGKLLELQPGETVRFTGSWTVHKDYGQQFKAEAMHLITTSKDSVESYLASGLIDGIDKRTARRILDFFGANAIDILDSQPSRIGEVPGINTTRAKMIAASWSEQRRSRKVMLFLQNYGITAGLAHKIFETYGDDTIKEVEKNPYQLAVDIEGVGFKVADEIAQAMGLANDSPPRVRAGILYALNTLGTEGNVYGPRPLVIEKTCELLGVTPDLCEAAITALKRQKDIYAVKKKNGPSGNIEALYLPKMFDNEQSVAEKLRAIAAGKASTLKKVKTFDWNAFFEKLATTSKVVLTTQQQEAVHATLSNKICVLTGGPGTGKTTTLRTVIRALDAIEANYVLASPTGRAARRLNEATDRPARTIHRLLGYSVDGGFINDESNPLDGDIVIIDEASMLDLELFARLLDAMTEKMHLMLVGDVDQLPSVGAGDVLHDVIDSGLAHVTRLDEVFRQASDSHVTVNAHRINRGEMPDLSNSSRDFFLFNVAEGEAALDLLVDVVSKRIPTKFNLDPLNDVQVLAPMYKGEIGITALNDRLQAVLNPLDRNVEHVIAGRKFRMGDKVIQTRNNYEKDVYNGDIGRITEIDPVKQVLEIDFDGRLLVEYDWKEAGDLFHAFAISIHRSQGSEYPAVVIPVMVQHSRMLQRNLIYTAITRAKQLVVLVGTRRAIQMAVDNDRVAHRYSGLVWQIQNPPNLP
ncbi:MAG: ATP-dependent RecD-like DNA helicase [Chloroflexota bacterium]